MIEVQSPSARHRSDMIEVQSLSARHRSDMIEVQSPSGRQRPSASTQQLLNRLYRVLFQLLLSAPGGFTPLLTRQIVHFKLNREMEKTER